MRWPFRLGFGLLALGAGPLLLYLGAAQIGLVHDPDPNPIGLGLLFFVTFWPAMGLILFGVFGRKR